MQRLTIVAAMVVLMAGWGRAAEEKPYEADEHAVLLLHMDEGEGEVTADASASELQVRLEEPPRQPTWEEEGMFGKCLRFDGVNTDEDGDGKGDADALIFTDDGELAPKEELTVEAWIKPANLPAYMGILTRDSGARYNFYVQKSGLYFLVAMQREGGTDWGRLTVGNVLTPGKWQHVAATYDGEAIRLYVNGVEVGKQSVSGKPAEGGTTSHIGCDGDLRPLDSAIRGFKGLIDEVRVSNIARTEFNVSEERAEAQASVQGVQPAPQPELPDRPKFPDPPLPVLNERHVVITGRVLDNAGKPLVGVLVSDGEHVVKTDEQGAYQLEFEVKDLRLVFVTRPRGYKPVDSWFERIPRNEEKTEYQRDFRFAPDPLADREQFTFLSTGDTQFSDLLTFVHLLDEYDQLTEMSGNPAFFTIAGDLTMTGCQWEMDMYKDVWAKAHIRVYNVFGGHDGNYARAQGGSGSVYHYQKNLAPAWYSWEYGPVHFATYVSESSFITGRQQQLQSVWLEADLAAQPPGKPIVLTTHQPPSNEVMQAWLDKYNIIGLLFGHWHQIHSCGYGGVPYLETGPMRGRDWGGFTRQFRVIAYGDGKLSSEIRVCGQVQRLDIIAPQGTVSRGSVPVQIKAYHTARRIAKVTCEIGAGGQTVQVPLTRAGAWSWQGSWDASQAPAGKIEVRATAEDEDGRTWDKTATIELADRQLQAVQPGDDWPGFFRTEHSRAREQPLPAPLELAWAANTGGRNMKAVSPIVYGGRLYVGVQNKEIGHPDAGVSCYDPATGKLLWQGETDASISFGLAGGDGLVYAIDSMGVCYAFDAESGTEKWRADPFPPGNGRRNVCSCPMLYEDVLLAFSDSGQCAFLDAKTGEQQRVLQPAGGWMYFTFPSMHDGRLLVGFRRKAVACDPETGDQMWATDISTGKAASCPVPYRGALYINASALTCLDEKTGKERWHQGVPTSGNGISVAVPAGDLVLANGSALRAFDAENGELRWQHQFIYDVETAKCNQRQVYAGQSTPLVAGDVVYLGSDDGHLYAFALADGELLWQYNLGVPIKGSPVVSGNALFICDWDGNLYCFVGS